MVHCNIFFLQCTIPMSCSVSIKGGTTGRDKRGTKGTLAMFNDLMNRARSSIAKRKHYNRLVAEIDSFSSRDLADMRADRSEMLYQIHKQIYG